MNFKSWVVTVAVATVLAVCDVNLRAQAPVRFVGMGDSIGEGVQSGDANAVTQQFQGSEVHFPATGRFFLGLEPAATSF